MPGFNKITRPVALAAIALLVVLGSLVLRPSVPSGSRRSEVSGLALGDVAPDFQLLDLAGRSLSLRGNRGRWILINFWGVTCVPCTSEMPAMQTAYQGALTKDHSARHPLIIGIDGNLDAPPSIARFLRETGVNYPVAIDSLLRASVAYHIGGIPTSVLIDPRGSLRYIHVGPLLTGEIARLLRGQIVE